MFTSRKILPLALITCLALSPFAHAQSSGPTPYPSSNDSWPGVGPIRVFPWMTDNRDYFWTKRDQKQGAVVFTGDSLIGNWKSLEHAFPGLNVANRGIGGDVSRGLLFRFQEDVLDLHPKAIVVLIGTNDLSAHAAPSGVIDNLSAMIAMANAQDATMPIIVCTVPPRANPKAPTRPGALDDLNSQIRALASAQVKVLDLFAAFSTSEGAPDPRYFNSDLLHFNAAGFAKFQEVVQPLLSFN